MLPVNSVRFRGLSFLHRRFGRTLPTCLGLIALAGLALMPPAQVNAATRDVRIISFGPGKTPFINLVQAKMDDTSLLDHVQFTIAPKPGSVTRPVSARYSTAYLIRRGFLNASTGGFTVPVFGLYQGYENSVQVVFAFVDGTSQVNNLLLTSPKYVSGIFDQPKITVQPRTTDTTLSYDFMELKSYFNPHSPTIVDTDGEIRWVGTSDTASMEAIFYNNSFFVVKNAPSASPMGGSGTVVVRNEFDGGVTTVRDFASTGITTFHHNFDFGKSGILVAVNTPQYLESIVWEIDTAGNILHQWDLIKIFTDAMVAGGDDPTQFVAQAGTQLDWFHNNANTYRPSDDTLIVSSRENFVVALDYETGAIKWIIGDITKQWYQFPSLRKFALRKTLNTHYPIGQHAVSIYQDKLLLFDDGYYSADHTPKGLNRTYSAPRKYTVDQAAGTYTEIWNYLNKPSLYSPITSSVYEDQEGSYLIDYSVVGPYLFSEVMGLNPAGAKVYDYKYTEINTADTSWNAVPIHLENLVFN